MLTEHEKQLARDFGNATVKRMENGRTRFIDSIIEIYGKTERQAEQVLNVFLSNKVVKINKSTGSFDVIHGGYLEPEVIERCLTLFDYNGKQVL